MSIRRTDPEEALVELLKQNGPFVSLYLPYGVQGIDEQEMSIERKNALNQARSKLAASSLEDWARRIKEIETDIQTVDLNGGLDNPELPYTRIYFAGPSFVIQTDLPAALRPHFSFAPFAEIEPLVYSHWAREPYWVVQLNSSALTFMHGMGARVEDVDPVIPPAQQNGIGSSKEDFTLENVIMIADKNRDPGSDLDQQRSNVYHGFTSRQLGKQERNEDFWLQVVTAVCRETIAQRPGNVFFAGSNKLVRKLSALLAKHIPREFYFLKASESVDNRTIVNSVRNIITNRKLEKADKEFEEALHQDNIHDVLDLVESGRTRKLFVHQENWFTESNVTNDSYEISNPRAVILAKALRNRADVAYIRSRINNKHGLAALTY